MLPAHLDQRADFAEVVQRYYKRWDISIPEDNEISGKQQIGLSSPFSRPGRLSHAEPLVQDATPSSIASQLREIHALYEKADEVYRLLRMAIVRHEVPRRDTPVEWWPITNQ